MKRCVIHGCAWCTCPPPVDLKKTLRDAKERSRKFFESPEGKKLIEQLRRDLDEHEKETKKP